MKQHKPLVVLSKPASIDKWAVDNGMVASEFVTQSDHPLLIAYKGKYIALKFDENVKTQHIEQIFKHAINELDIAEDSDVNLLQGLYDIMESIIRLFISIYHFIRGNATLKYDKWVGKNKSSHLIDFSKSEKIEILNK